MEYSNEIKIVVNYALEEAARLGSLIATPDHLFLGILRYKESDAVSVLTGLGADVKKMKQEIEAKIMAPLPIPFEKRGSVSLSEKSQEIIASCRRLHLTQMTPAHLMAEIFANWSGACTTALENSDIALERIPDAIRNLLENIDNEAGETEFAEAPHSGGNSAKEKAAGSSMLDTYGYDLTAAARSGELDPVIGRSQEIERIAQILSRRKKNNPVLIGESGSGKSAIVEGLAQRIAGKRVPRTLLNKRVITLDLGAVVAGTKYRGQFEERIKSIISQVKKDPDIILFIDELHTLIGAGSSPGSLDAANLLKPALARGQVQCIGATTLDEYREHIEKDAALERRFQKVVVNPTDFDQTLAILEGIRGRYEEYHSVIYDESALRACISLTQRYIPDRCLPDKAIDVLDEAGARAHIGDMKVPQKAVEAEDRMALLREEKREAARSGDFKRAARLHLIEKQEESEMEASLDAEKNEEQVKKVSAEDIAEVVSLMTGIPVSKVAAGEGERLLNMEKILKGVVVGQDDALSKVVRAIRRNRAGLKNPDKPIGTFLFLGPTGVGKTHLAKKIAEFLFDSQDNIIRIDMSEYVEKFSSSRLIGAPPGYVGYNEGGQLSEQVRRKPYSVVLLDEVEKAHPDIFNMLLQVLDEGRLTDSAGRYVDFRNTVLILTSNVGSREIRDFGGGVGFVTDSVKRKEDSRRSIIDKALGKVFTPEFLNRLDEQIYFNSLTQEDIYKIIDIELRDLHKRMALMGYSLTIMPAARKFIALEGFDPQMGARPLKRAIQHYVEDPVSECILEGIPEGAHLKLHLSRNRRDTVVRIA